MRRTRDPRYAVLNVALSTSARTGRVRLEVSTFARSRWKSRSSDSPPAAGLGDLGQLIPSALAIAEMKGPVKDRIRRYGLAQGLFFPTLGVAVKEYLQRTGVERRDWQDEGEETGDSGPGVPGR